MRLFTAINFTGATKSRLLDLRDELKKTSSDGSFSAPENLHLTLVFLGECNSAMADAAKKVMDSVRFNPFEIEIDRVGRFSRDGGDIWWAGVKENKALLELQRDLASGFKAAGFEIENRKYNPHITLGRKVISSEKARQIELFGETAGSVELMKSERINGKLTYTAIHKIEG